MAEEDDFFKKQARALQEDLNPRNKTSNGAKSTGKVRNRVEISDLFPGAVFKMTQFPLDRNGTDNRFLACMDYWVGNTFHPKLWEKPEGWAKAYIARQPLYYTVKVVCVPIKRSKLVLVERWPDGTLGVVEL